MIDYSTFKYVVEALQKRIHKVEVREEPFTTPFGRGGTIVASAGITDAINVIVWRATIDCTVTAVYGYRVGGTGATINARKNNTLNHLASALSVTSANTWMSGGAVQNAAYVVGDELEIMVVSATGGPTQIAVQVDYVPA